MASTISRVDFVRAGLGATGALVVAGSAKALAATSQHLKIGFISPRTGPLGGFGETDPYVLGLVRATLDHGFTIGGTRYDVTILDRDSQSDPSRASQLAKELIGRDGVDMMLAISTPEVVNPVSDACEAAGVPCLSTVLPWESWYFGRGAKPGAPSPFKWSFHFSFGVREFVETYLSEWQQLSTNKKVGVLYPNDADGNAFREHVIPELRRGGYTVIDPGGYQDGTTDYSAQISRFKAEQCEIFNTLPIPPDFVAFWRQAAQQGYTRMVKIAEVAKFGLFPSSIEALGSLGNGIATGAYWHPIFPYKSSLTGISSRALADGYEKSSGRQWTQQLGATMSLFDSAFAGLRRSGAPKNKGAIAKALTKLKVTTTVGTIDFSRGPVGNVATTPLVGSQWIKNPAGSKYPYSLVTTEHAVDPSVPIMAKLQPYGHA